MSWKEDRLRPTQPYFVFDTDCFYQEVYLRQGISHFYTYRVGDAKKIRVVPDGCIDFFFEYDGRQMKGFVCGTPIVYKEQDTPKLQDVFGVRFMPGVQPELIQAMMKEVFDKQVPVEPLLKGDSHWIERLAGETDFYQRIRVFLEAYTRAEKKKEVFLGKKELVLSVKQMVYNSDGKIKVSELQENTGYSKRYINKVFIEEMGFSPKTFCKIIQFQRALEFLNYGAPEKMTDAAVKLGYYDQSQFIRDFTKYAGITPRKYLKLVESEHYKNKVTNTNSFGNERKL